MLNFSWTLTIIQYLQTKQFCLAQQPLDSQITKKNEEIKLWEMRAFLTMEWAIPVENSRQVLKKTLTLYLSNFEFEQNDALLLKKQTEK